MAAVELKDEEWQQVLGMISMAPWRDANPLLMKIGEQLRLQASKQQTNSQEVPGAQGEVASRRAN